MIADTFHMDDAPKEDDAFLPVDELLKRPGKLKVDREIMLSPVFRQHVLSKFVPWRVELLHFGRRFEVWAYSEFFEEIPEMSFVPTYRIELTEKSDGTADVRFQKEPAA